MIQAGRPPQQHEPRACLGKQRKWLPGMHRALRRLAVRAHSPSRPTQQSLLSCGTKMLDGNRTAPALIFIIASHPGLVPGRDKADRGISKERTRQGGWYEQIKGASTVGDRDRSVRSGARHPHYSLTRLD